MKIAAYFYHLPKRSKTFLALTIFFLALGHEADPAIWVPQPPPAVLLAKVAMAHDLPEALLQAIWARECSSRVVCPRGLKGEWGPFQIMPTTAKDIKCWGRWWDDFEDNARCAAQVLLAKGAKRGRYLRALSRYNGCHLPCRSNHYGFDVYNDYLKRLFKAAQKHDDRTHAVKESV